MSHGYNSDLQLTLFDSSSQHCRNPPHMLQQCRGISEFVVIPGEYGYEVAVRYFRQRCIHDPAIRLSDNVRGNHLVVRDIQYL